MYKILGNFLIRRLSDGSIIPKDESNYDYKNYLKWLSEGNVPEPEFTLEELKNNKMQYVTQQRDEALNTLTSQWDDDLWDARETDSTRITNVLTMIEQAQKINIPTPSTIDWRTYDNKDRSLTVPELIQLAASMFLAQQTIWAKQAQLKNAVTAATTIEEVEAITW